MGRAVGFAIDVAGAGPAAAKADQRLPTLLNGPDPFEWAGHGVIGSITMKSRFRIVECLLGICLIALYIGSYFCFAKQINISEHVFPPGYHGPSLYRQKVYISRIQSINRVSYFVFWPLIAINHTYDGTVYIYDTSWMNNLER